MFKNVLVGVDGRIGGRDAIALALQLTDRNGKLTLAHVRRELLPSDPPDLFWEEREGSDALLERERSSVEENMRLLGIEAKSPGRGLHEVAEKQGCDLLVVGSCSRGVLGRAALGDDTRAALNGAPCAVAIAALGYHGHPSALTRIGVAYNGSPESQAALATARRIAGARGSRVRALEVVVLPVVTFSPFALPPLEELLEEILSDANERMKALPDVDGRAVYGLPGDELAIFSGELDLLVAGSRGYGPLKRLVLGSTCDYLERFAHCSLLLLPRTSSNADSPSEALPAPERALR